MINFKNVNSSYIKFPFLGFVVTKDGISIDRNKVEVITSWKRPTTIIKI